MNCLPDQNAKLEERIEYETPAIIFEGEISTRAGSTLSNPSGVDDIDPADLLGN
jgi:hypothetical protein